MSEVSPAQAVEVLQQDQQQRWRHGQHVPVETYLQGCPSLQTNPDAILDLIVGEVLLRQELGESPTLEEYLWRFPQFAEPLRQEFDLDRALLGSSDTIGPSQEEDSGGRRGDSPAVPGYEVHEEV